MVTFIARLRIHPGHEEEAKQIIADMVQAVGETEDGALAYCAHLSEANPLELVVYEMYAGKEAQQTHFETPHFENLKSKIGTVFDADFGVAIEELTHIAAVCRQV